MKSEHTCQIFAHRGANRLALENTHSAFNKALEYPIDGIETDVQLTRDGIPVLWHDSFLDKLGLADKRIDDFDFEQLITISISAGLKSGEIMSLKQFLNTYRGHCTLNIEVKNRDWESTPRQQNKILLTQKMIDSATVNDIFISSFNLPSLVFAHQNSDRIPLFYILTEQHTLTDIKNDLQEHSFLTGFCLPISLINESIIQYLREHNKYIVTYTCNSEAEIYKALNNQVDIMITDEPQKALELNR